MNTWKKCLNDDFYTFLYPVNNFGNIWGINVSITI